MNNEIIISCGCDNEYAMPMAVMLKSAEVNCSNKLHIYILDGGISQENKEKILSSLSKSKVTWLTPPIKKIRSLHVPKEEHFSIGVYLRLLIPEVLPSEIKKIIYLDSDLIIKEDLTKLWNIPIENKPLLAVQDACVPYLPQVWIKNPRKSRLDPNTKCFSSGVLVINLDIWRKEKIAEKAIEYIKKYEPFLVDQEALNAILANRWGELDPRWNPVKTIYVYKSWKESAFNEETYNNMKNNPYIIHFCDNFKPYFSKCCQTYGTHPCLSTVQLDVCSKSPALN